MADPLPAPSPAPSLHEVERLPALGGAELVRARGLGLAAPVLVAAERRVEPLPEAPLGRVPGEWSASYVVPAEAAGGALALEWPEGPCVDLPAAPPRRVPRLGPAAPPWEPHRVALERELGRAAAVAAAAREETAARIAEQAADMRLVRDQAAGRVARAEQLAASAGARAREAAEAAALAEARLEAEVIARGALGAELDRVAAEASRLSDALAAASAARRVRSADADALAVLAAELDAERTAHAVTRGTLARLREELAAARRASPPPVTGPADGSPGPANGARGEGAPARLIAAAALSPRAPVAAGSAGDLRRLGLAQAAAAAAAAPAAGPPRVVADLDAAAAALRQATRPLLARRLRDVLVSLAREDPVAAGELLVALLPAQGAVIDGRLSYDLTVRGVGTYAVTVDGGAARAVRLPRPRRHADFALSADPLALAAWLAGEEIRIGRLRGPIRRRGSRRALARLRTLPQTTLSLAEAARAGANLEPRLVYRALTHAVQPEWTRGHRFVVAQALPEATFYLAARDGAGLALLDDARPDATVTLSREAFDRLLRDEPPLPRDRPSVRGDRAAVTTLREWVDRARGGHNPSAPAPIVATP